MHTKLTCKVSVPSLAASQTQRWFTQAKFFSRACLPGLSWQERWVVLSCCVFFSGCFRLLARRRHMCYSHLELTAVKNKMDAACVNAKEGPCCVSAFACYFIYYLFAGWHSDIEGIQASSPQGCISVHFSLSMCSKHHILFLRKCDSLLS